MAIQESPRDKDRKVETGPPEEMRKKIAEIKQVQDDLEKSRFVPIELLNKQFVI